MCQLLVDCCDAWCASCCCSPAHCTWRPLLCQAHQRARPPAAYQLAHKLSIQLELRARLLTRWPCCVLCAAVACSLHRQQQGHGVLPGRHGPGQLRDNHPARHFQQPSSRRQRHRHCQQSDSQLRRGGILHGRRECCAAGAGCDCTLHL